MKILLTRSLEENQRIMANTENAGLFLSAPMLSYQALAVAWQEFKEYSDFVITSKFAAVMVAGNVHYPAQVWVVGTESAEIISCNPLLSIAYTATNVLELETVIPSGSIYFSGDIITQPLEKAVRYVVYKVHYAKNLAENIVKAILSGEICGIMVYSANSARNLIDLLKSEHVLDYVKNMTIIAISPKVGDLWVSYCNTIKVAVTPSHQEMLTIALELIKKKI